MPDLLYTQAVPKEIRPFFWPRGANNRMDFQRFYNAFELFLYHKPVILSYFYNTDRIAILLQNA